MSIEPLSCMYSTFGVSSNAIAQARAGALPSVRNDYSLRLTALLSTVGTSAKPATAATIQTQQVRERREPYVTRRTGNLHG